MRSRKWASYRTYDAQVSNAGPNGNQLFSVGYYDNKGIVKTTGFGSPVRLNTDYKLFGGALLIGLKTLSLTKTEKQADIINSAFTGIANHSCSYRRRHGWAAR